MEPSHTSTRWSTTHAVREASWQCEIPPLTLRAACLGLSVINPPIFPNPPTSIWPFSSIRLPLLLLHHSLLPLFHLLLLIQVCAIFYSGLCQPSLFVQFETLVPRSVEVHCPCLVLMQPTSYSQNFAHDTLSSCSILSLPLSLLYYSDREGTSFWELSLCKNEHIYIYIYMLVFAEGKFPEASALPVRVIE